MTDKVAIVTGAARGIGSAIAKRLAMDGMAVAVCDLDEDACRPTVDAIAEGGGTALAVRLDVADETSASAAVDRVGRELGAPLVLVNNAGITRDNLLFKMSADDWTSVLDVHLKGAFLMTRAAQASMVKANWGRIVNLSSLSALGNRGQANYAAAKAGVQGLTKSLAIELGKFGVTANAIAPGFIETDMTRQTAARIGVSYDDFKSGAAAQIAVHRVGQPEDVANLASFLASDQSSFLSGQVIYLTGGPAA